jgi:beta-N-acetylhexosaminidase
MGMKGVVKYFPNGEADVRGVLAGMDVLELSENSKRAIKLIRKSIRHHRLSWDDIDEKVKRILAAKYWMGLNNLLPVNTENVVKDLNRPESKQLVQKLTDASLTVLKNESVIPLRNDFVRKTAIITIGPKEPTIFAQDLKKNNPNTMLFIIPKDISMKELEAVTNQLKNYDQFIVSIYDTRLRPQSTLDFNTDIKLFIAAMASKNTITVVFANPYSIAGLPGIEKSKALLVGYQNMPEMEHSAAKVLIGTLKASGTLPVTINAFFKYGDGL